jgi:hypothetical protein
MGLGLPYYPQTLHDGSIRVTPRQQRSDSRENIRLTKVTVIIVDGNLQVVT